MFHICMWIKRCDFLKMVTGCLLRVRVVQIFGWIFFLPTMMPTRSATIGRQPEIRDSFVELLMFRPCAQCSKLQMSFQSWLLKNRIPSMEDRPYIESWTRFQDNSYFLPLIHGQTWAKLMKLARQPGRSLFIKLIYQLDSPRYFWIFINEGI